MMPIPEGSLNSNAPSAIELIYSEKETCRAILGEHGNPQFLERIWELFRPRGYTKYSRMGINEEDFAFIYTYITAGCIGVIRAWASSDFQESPEKIASYLERLTYSGFSGFVKV
jgi:hypothetical protein